MKRHSSWPNRGQEPCGCGEGIVPPKLSYESHSKSEQTWRRAYSVSERTRTGPRANHLTPHNSDLAMHSNRARSGVNRPAIATDQFPSSSHSKSQVTPTNRSTLNATYPTSRALTLPQAKAYSDSRDSKPHCCDSHLLLARKSGFCQTTITTTTEARNGSFGAESESSGAARARTGQEAAGREFEEGPFVVFCY